MGKIVTMDFSSNGASHWAELGRLDEKEGLEARPVVIWFNQEEDRDEFMVQHDIVVLSK